jgi:hypothetical protein
MGIPGDGKGGNQAKAPEARPRSPFLRACGAAPRALTRAFAYTLGMTFGSEVLAIFIGDILASALLVLLYALVQWFLRATDITIGYGWKWEGTNFHPSFDIRNRSGSKSYLLANIAYTRNNGKDVVAFDNKSIWGKELKPGSITYLEVSPVPSITSVPQCTGVEITVRLQTGRMFWLKGQGPGQLRIGRIQKMAFWLRQKFEKAAIPLE